MIVTISKKIYSCLIKKYISDLHMSRSNDKYSSKLLEFKNT